MRQLIKLASVAVLFMGCLTACSGSCKAPFGGFVVGAYPDPEHMTHPSQPVKPRTYPHDHGQWTKQPVN